MDPQLLEFAANAIREYLTQRPESADTIEGIHRWWIHWPGLAESPVVTQIALERLAAAGEIESFNIGDRVVWRRPHPHA